MSFPIPNGIDLLSMFLYVLFDDTSFAMVILLIFYFQALLSIYLSIYPSTHKHTPIFCVLLVLEQYGFSSDSIIRFGVLPPLSFLAREILFSQGK